MPGKILGTYVLKNKGRLLGIGQRGDLRIIVRPEERHLGATDLAYFGWITWGEDQDADQQVAGEAQ